MPTFLSSDLNMRIHLQHEHFSRREGMHVWENVSDQKRRNTVHKSSSGLAARARGGCAFAVGRWSGRRWKRCGIATRRPHRDEQSNSEVRIFCVNVIYKL